jgi:hypothetical protein
VLELADAAVIVTMAAQSRKATIASSFLMVLVGTLLVDLAMP